MIFVGFFFLSHDINNGTLVISQNLTKVQGWKGFLWARLPGVIIVGSEEPDLECCKTQHNELDRQPDFCFQPV